MNRLNRNGKACSVLVSMVFTMFFGVMMVEAAPPWEQTQKLLPSDGDAIDNFGNSVAFSGNIAVIGAPYHNNVGNGTQSGAAYVFDISTGRQLFTLLAADGEVGESFGNSVALDGNLAIIGSYFDNDNGTDSGSAYVFDVTTGRQLLKLLPSDGTTGDFFGQSVAISGNLAVIGSRFNDDNGTDSGSAYVFDVTTGRQLLKLLPSDGSSKDYFGHSVALNGNLAIIGAIGGDGNVDFSGSVYVFDITTGQQLSKLHATDGAAGDEFGYSVALDGNLMVIGASQDHNGNSGSAYVFNITTGQQLFKLLATDGIVGDNFGYSVALNGNLAIIGAKYGDGDVADSGSAYVFDITTGQQLFKIFATDGEIGDQFGNSVALNGNLAVIGAPDDDANGQNSGSAYVFQQQPASHLIVFPDPLIANQDGTFTITQALPNELTGLIYSLDGLQNTFIRQLNVVINIANPKLAVNPRMTDANGDLQYILPMPFVVSPIDVWFQAVQVRNATNFVATQIVP